MPSWEGRVNNYTAATAAAASSVGGAVEFQVNEFHGDNSGAEEATEAVEAEAEALTM